MCGEVFQTKVAHGGAGLVGGTADVGQENGARVLEQGGGHLRLVFKDIQADPADVATGEMVDESGFIDDAAAGDVDENAGGAEGGEHGGIDEVMSRRAAGAGEDEEVGVLGELGGAGAVGVGDVLRVAAVVGDLHAAGLQAVGDGFANATEAEDTGGFATECGSERELFLLPVASMEKAIGGEQLAAGHEDERSGKIGDIVCEHIGRIGHADAAGAAGVEIDAVITDAADGDELEGGQLGNKRRWHLTAAIADEDAGGGGVSGEGAGKGSGRKSLNTGAELGEVGVDV